MYDKGLSVLERYGLTSQATYRGRGALICETQAGLKQIKPFEGSEKRLERQNRLLEHLQACGHEHLDIILRNEEGSLTTTDKEGYTYLVKNWWDGRECDVKNQEDVCRGMQQLARLHKDMFLKTEQGETPENLIETYQKHNQGMKKIRSYVRRRRQKNDFEYLFLKHVERYLSYGARALEQLEQSGYPEMRRQCWENGTVCHGEYNQHNILMCGEQIAAVNFDHFRFEDQTADIAQFMRKMMEKHGWNRGLAEDMLEAYSSVRPLSHEEWNCLAIRLSYPEKFWKVTSFYYNNNKAFLSSRHQEKMVNLLRQETLWQEFMNSFFGNSLFPDNPI